MVWTKHGWLCLHCDLEKEHVAMVKIVATINGRLKELGPFKYPNSRVDQALEAVKLGKTSYQKGTPAPDAKIVHL